MPGLYCMSINGDALVSNSKIEDDLFMNAVIMPAVCVCFIVQNIKCIRLQMAQLKKLP